MPTIHSATLPALFPVNGIGHNAYQVRGFSIILLDYNYRLSPIKYPVQLSQPGSFRGTPTQLDRELLHFFLSVLAFSEKYGLVNKLYTAISGQRPQISSTAWSSAGTPLVVTVRAFRITFMPHFKGFSI